MNEKNLELWNRHFKPHDDALRKAPKGLTAIDPMWTIREATIEWGPMGGKWGFEIQDETVIKSDISGTQVHTVKIKLWYPGGTIQSFGGTTMDGEHKSGAFFNDDYAKMSVTDALSKALSWLGFGAAVHMGMFDGNKYIDFRPSETATVVKPEPDKAPPAEDIVAVTNAVTKAVLSVEELRETSKEKANRGVDKLGAEVYTQWHMRAITNITGEETLDAVTNKTSLINFIQAQNEFIGKE